jgi:DUF4097 and DUF4098 domain-containing protein YvlB
MKSASLSAAVLVFGGVLASACVVNVDTQAEIVREEKRFTVKGTPDVRLTTFDGAIEVQSWDRPEVLVEIEKRGATKEAVDALQITQSQNGNRIELEVKPPDRESFRGFYRTASAKLIVSVPRDTDLAARSGDGSIQVERVSGRIDLHTGDGSIRATDVSGDLTVNTGDGSITVNDAAGRLDVDTGDGGVTVSGRLTRLKIHTGDGSITYRAASDSHMTEDSEITTGDGSVTLYLPEGFDAELDAHTGDGTIRNDLQIQAAGSPGSKEERRRALRGRMGEGGRLLRIRTGDGAIRLRPA